MKTKEQNSILHKLWPLLFWFLVWWLLSIKLDNRILLVSPLEMVQRLFFLVQEAEFWRVIFHSCLKILLGFLAGLFVGAVLAVLSSRFLFIRRLFSPLILIAKAVPVASVIILMLVWISSADLSVAVSFMMVLPLIYSNLAAGIEALDPKLEEMAAIFRVPLSRKFRDLYLTQLMPFLIPAVRTAFGFAFKSGIAAEVIGIPDLSIGEKLYKAKVFLDMPDLFAWTMVIIALSFLFEQSFVHLLACLQNRVERRSPYLPEVDATLAPSSHAEDGDSAAGALRLRGLSKSYADKVVLKELDLHISPAVTTAVMGPSGSGKTTLLRLLAGLESADGGSVLFRGKPFPQAGALISVVFQEDRLLPSLSALRNLSFVSGRNLSLASLRTLLHGLGLHDEIWQPSRTLSGGMRRRVALARALASPAELYLLDEPFKGLDEETKDQVMRFCREKLRGQSVLLITHDEKEAAAMGAVEILQL